MGSVNQTLMNDPARWQETRRLRTDLRASVADGAAFSVMVGLGETYLPAFVLAVGHGEILAGLTATVPMLAGAVLQLGSPRLVARAGSHRRWVIACAVVQAAAFVPLFAAALAGRIPWTAVVLIATLYWGAGQAAGPAWNTWMAGVVPRRLRAPYFSRRTRAAQASVLAGLLAGGGILHLAAGHDATLLGFAVLFGAACCFRMVSVGFLVRQRGPRAPLNPDQRVSPLLLWTRVKRRDGRLLAYMFAVQTTTYVAAPYFTPFMLGQLRLSYSTYMLLLTVAFVAKIVALPALGRFAQRFDAVSLLWLGGIGIVPLAALWAVSSAAWYLAALQVLGGVAWASYELATVLLLYETIRDEERTSVLTSFNLLNAVAIVAGSLVGGLILRLGGAGHYAYVIVFLVSSAGRLLTVGLLHGAAGVPRVPVWTRIGVLAVRPSAGSVDRPILSTIPEPASDNDHDVAPPGRSDQAGCADHAA